MSNSLKRTPLYDAHVKLGAKMVPFASWEMPVKYSGLIEEHLAVRSRAGLFDVSHMGEIEVKGPEAERALSYLCCNDVTKLVDGKAQYSAITTPSGGLVDDIIIYRLAEQSYLVCVNASNSDRDFAWFKEHNKFNATFIDRSLEYGQIAIQGPRALNIFRKYSKIGAEQIPAYFYHTSIEVDGVPHLVARTGYTGEDGVEIFLPWNKTATVWQTFVEIGKEDGLLPCGLGARDTLRLEAALPLYGHELGEDISAVESGIAPFVKIGDRDFLGRDILKRHKEDGPPRSLIGFFVEDPGIVRDGSKLFDSDGVEIGFVTSGTKTPSFEKPLGLGIVQSDRATLDSLIYAEVRGKQIGCRITKRPFYKRS